VTVRASTTGLDDSLEGIAANLEPSSPDKLSRSPPDNGIIFLRGTVKNLNNSARAKRLPPRAEKLFNLLNVRCATGRPQILLKVRFESVDRTKETQLGINLFSSGFGTRSAQSPPANLAARLNLPQEVLRRWRRPFRIS